MMWVSINGKAWSEKTTQTVQIVRKTIEQIKNTPEDQLGYYGYEESDGIFQQWAVEDSYEDGGSLKKVTVWVYWRDEFNRPK